MIFYDPPHDPNYYLMVKFNLYNKTDDLSPIRLIYVFGNGQRFRWSTGKKVSPKKKYWDYSKQRARKAWPNSESLNTFLDSCAKIVIDVHNQLRSAGQMPTKQDFRNALDQGTARPSSIKQQGVLAFMEAFKKKRERSGDFSATTILTYGKRIGLFERFFKARRTYTFDEIDLDFIYKLKEWMVYDNDYKLSYVKKAVQFLKMIMEESYEQGMHKNLSFRSKFFTVKQNVSDKIALTWEEVQRIASWEPDNLPGRKAEAMKKIRDRFVVGCYLGQRFSDLFKVHLDQCYEQNGQMMFRFRSKKVGKPTIIPINKVVADILESYGGSLPPISNQKFNEQVKELFKLAKFNEQTIVYEEKQGRLIEKSYPKHELIYSHTMRRTFITNALAEGIAHSVIMDVAGITNYNTLLRYNKSAKDRSAMQVAKSNLYRIDRKAE